MLAGGSGITPMYQVACAILNNPSDRTKVGWRWMACLLAAQSEVLIAVPGWWLLHRRGALSGMRVAACSACGGMKDRGMAVAVTTWRCLPLKGPLYNAHCVWWNEGPLS